MKAYPGYNDENKLPDNSQNTSCVTLEDFTETSVNWNAVTCVKELLIHHLIPAYQCLLMT